MDLEQSVEELQEFGVRIQGSLAAVHSARDAAIKVDRHRIILNEDTGFGLRIHRLVERADVSSFPVDPPHTHAMELRLHYNGDKVEMRLTLRRWLKMLKEDFPEIEISYSHNPNREGTARFYYFVS